MAGVPIQSPNLGRGLPVGQKYVRNFPVYDITPSRPKFDAQSWRFRAWGAVQEPLEWTWEEFRELPAVKVVADFHCVTKWSKKALRWKGVPTRVIVDLIKPKSDAVQVMAHCLEGYTTNVPAEYLRLEDSILAFEMDGKPLTPNHGAPLRLLVPQLYAWKSAKYVSGLEYQTTWRPGFWEQRGYHMIGDPWEEQRYWEPIEKVREWWRKVRVAKVERPGDPDG
ncbi:MAG: sulfite oxidase-like oxidoreductase [Thermoplasmata archaeon]